MREVFLCLEEIALVTVLALASSAVIVEVGFCCPDVAITPITPTTSDNVDVTVSYLFGSAPPNVQEFGPFVQLGNTFSVNVAVYFPAPEDIVLFIVHTDYHTYSLGSLPVGEYEFKVYINRTHFMEDFFLAEIVHFNVTFLGDIDHDFDVDIFDAVKCGIAYGSTPSDPAWNSHCDIAEQYGIINVFDIVTVATNYGERYTS